MNVLFVKGIVTVDDFEKQFEKGQKKFYRLIIIEIILLIILAGLIVERILYG